MSLTDEAIIAIKDCIAIGEKLLTQRDELAQALRRLLQQHDKPHGFEDNDWYARDVEFARAALAKLDQQP